MVDSDKVKEKHLEARNRWEHRVQTFAPNEPEEKQNSPTPPSRFCLSFLISRKKKGRRANHRFLCLYTYLHILFPFMLTSLFRSPIRPPPPLSPSASPFINSSIYPYISLDIYISPPVTISPWLLLQLYPSSSSYLSSYVRDHISCNVTFPAAKTTEGGKIHLVLK